MKLWQQIALGILGFFALIVLVNEFEIAGVKFWGVRKENARREVFEQTQSYVEGKRQDLIKYHHEWVNASDEDKIAIEFTIRQSFSQFSEDKYLADQPDLYNFLKMVKNK
jgi:hypothetical protein